MKWLTSRVFWGILLIGGGIVFLLDNLGLVALGGLFWTVVLILLGLAFLSIYIGDRLQWWSLIPGVILLILGVSALLNYAFPNFQGNWTGGLVLGGIGLAFLLIYLTNRRFWWAIIPAGVMFTLAAVASLDTSTLGFDTGAIFMLGLALTFAVVGLLPTPEGQMKWAFIPAAILFVIGLFILAGSMNLVNYIWPVALILLGLYFIYRTLIARK